MVLLNNYLPIRTERRQYMVDTVKTKERLLSGKKNNSFLFDRIAPIYGLFYKIQKKRFSDVIQRGGKELDLYSFKTVIDIGCGTGALCSLLCDMGLLVTGIDPAKKMMEIAMKKAGNRSIRFVQADVLKGLPFNNKHFDVSIASYVAHGLQFENRKRMYAEMGRITKEKVIIYDYNKNRSLLTTVIEWMEQGDYFNFIKNAEKEMKDCVAEMRACFSNVEVVNVDTRAAWYICTPADKI